LIDGDGELGGVAMAEVGDLAAAAGYKLANRNQPGLS